ncbi:unnamed protein product [Rhodiola kirilowii]
MGLCCGKEAMSKNDQQVENERHVVEQEQLGFRFKIISPSKEVLNPSNEDEACEGNESSIELGKQDMELARASPRSILGGAFDDIKLLYTFGEQLGRGQSGITYRCIEKATGKSVACKSILKRKLLSKEDRLGVKREVEILKHLSGQPNIVEFKGVYEDRQSAHIVMELCEGGQLFDQITEKGHYSEKDAAVVFRQIINVVRVCHSMGVMHRDLKPENFLLSNKDERATVKAIDFGLAVLIEEGKLYKDLVGSVYYVAPEVLQGRYGKEIDVWSAGVILYMLLSGFPPFWAETDGGIFDAILTGNVDFESDPWPSISKSAKDLIRRMLTRDPRRRITAAQVLKHPWIKVDGEATDVPISSSIVSRIKQFGETNKLKQFVLKVVAENLSAEDITGLNIIFSKMDSEKSGTITYEDLKSGLTQLGFYLSEAEVQSLMKAADVNGDETIDYNEFIAATMDKQKLDNDEHLYKAFQRLDTDNSGFITRDELETALKKYGMWDEASTREMMKKADTNSDGKINYDELCALMRGDITPEASLRRFGSFHFSA